MTFLSCATFAQTKSTIFSSCERVLHWQSLVLWCVCESASLDNGRGIRSRVHIATFQYYFQYHSFKKNISAMLPLTWPLYALNFGCCNERGPLSDKPCLGVISSWLIRAQQTTGCPGLPCFTGLWSVQTCHWPHAEHVQLCQLNPWKPWQGSYVCVCHEFCLQLIPLKRTVKMYLFWANW